MEALCYGEVVDKTIWAVNKPKFEKTPSPPPQMRVSAAWDLTCFWSHDADVYFLA